MVKAFLFSNGSPTGLKFGQGLARQHDRTANLLERSFRPHLDRTADWCFGLLRSFYALIQRCMVLTQNGLIPALDQVSARSLVRVGDMNHAALFITTDRFAGAAHGEVPGGILLPCRKLAANFADLDPAVAFMDCAERRACFDGLQLLLVANQYDLRPGFGGMGQYALHLARADHARFVDDEHILGSQLLASLAPLMLKAGDGARCYTRAVLQAAAATALRPLDLPITFALK